MTSRRSGPTSASSPQGQCGGWQRINADPLLALLPGFLSPALATTLQQRLEQEIPWTSPTIRLYGKAHRIPRSQCWMGDTDARYRYSGRTLEPESWHPEIDALRPRIDEALRAAGLPRDGFNSVLINRYDGGEQRMGWHSDDEPELGNDPIVASISLGSERPLRFREKDRRPGNAFNVWLPTGSLLLMGPGCQARWQHALAPRAIDGVRINLTFRCVR
ncbi:alpha-ketoglutarate-dependent dioxygenase AlkB family protein [Salinicola avicenniae]|uniref:alpha-ketoglutarate-dependent dioxygenase AlkB family protein n=1 Tax=Salinicola avicenniae TaxID=2916836 RepID=UPI0020736829|nr:alpha-ketoglutarate-dependent dioxygenase AlkB [Salinicola sp. S1-1-8]